MDKEKIKEHIDAARRAGTWGFPELQNATWHIIKALEELISEPIPIEIKGPEDAVKYLGKEVYMNDEIDEHVLYKIGEVGKEKVFLYYKGRYNGTIGYPFTITEVK